MLAQQATAAEARGGARPLSLPAQPPRLRLPSSESVLRGAAHPRVRQERMAQELVDAAATGRAPI